MLKEEEGDMGEKSEVLDAVLKETVDLVKIDLKKLKPFLLEALCFMLISYFCSYELFECRRIYPLRRSLRI